MDKPVKVTIIPPVKVQALPYTRNFVDRDYERKLALRPDGAQAIPTKVKLDWSRCAICHRTRPHVKLVRDHDHATGYIRGILCEQCNSWLGIYENQRLGKRGKYQHWIISHRDRIETHLNTITNLFYVAGTRRKGTPRKDLDAAANLLCNKS